MLHICPHCKLIFNMNNNQIQDPLSNLPTYECPFCKEFIQPDSKQRTNGN